MEHMLRTVIRLVNICMLKCPAYYWMVKDEQKVTWHDPIWDGMLDSRVVPQKKFNKRYGDDMK